MKSCRKKLLSLGLTLIALAPLSAHASQVRGTLDPPSATPLERTLGYTRARVATPAASALHRRADLALFLKVKDSLTLPAPVPSRVVLVGMGVTPSVIACVIDGKIELQNDDVMPLAVSIGTTKLQLKPGETQVQVCTGEPGLRRITVEGWPHLRAALFVGDVGVAALPNAQGGFSLQAPTGKYELLVIGENGVLGTREVEVQKGDVDVGRLSFAGAQPLPEPEPAEPPKTESKPPAKAEPKPDAAAKAAAKEEPAKAAPKPAAQKKKPAQTLEFGADQDQGTE